MKTLLSVILTFAFVVCAVRAEGPDDAYVQVYDLIQQGDALGEAHQGQAALAKYKDALAELKKFRETYPAWDVKVVSYRLSYLAGKIAPLQIQFPEPLTPGGNTNALGVAAAPNGKVSDAAAQTALAQAPSNRDASKGNPAPGSDISSTVGAPNAVPDLVLPAETQWNHFSPELIPDSKIPTRFDPVVGTNMPVKWFIWHQPARNMFRTVTNGTDAEMFESERKAMFSKGITAVVGMMTRLPEREIDSPFDPATQLTVGRGTHDDEFRKDWDLWIKWWQGNVEEAGSWSKARNKNGKMRLFIAYPDYESTYTGAADQKAANFLTVANYAMLEKTAGYVAQQYLAPINTLGNISEDMYSGGSKTVAWFSPADGSVPERFRGKKNEGHPQIAGSIEVSHFYESWKPEGYMIKDQHGKNWFAISHFGPKPNVEHWAARVGGNIEVSQMYTRRAGQKMIAQLKVCNDRRSGFQYDPEYASSRGGKWNKEFNQHGITHPGPNNKDFLGSIGSETMPNFISEAQIVLGYFCGADGINFWGSAYYNEFKPRPREGNPERGEKHNDPAYGNVDREAYNYVLKALWRLAQPAPLEDGRTLSFYDICDGTEEYLNWNGKVSYDGGKTFQQLRALDWQLQKKTAVRAVVNRQKSVIYIMAFQPYGVEQNQVIVKYDANGCNFLKRLNVPAGKVVIQAYCLNGVSNEKATAQ